MQTLAIGDVTITSIIERDGPWRTPQDMFPDYDPIVGRQHLAELGAAFVRSDLRQNSYHLSDLCRAYARKTRS